MGAGQPDIPTAGWEPWAPALEDQASWPARSPGLWAFGPVVTLLELENKIQAV